MKKKRVLVIGADGQLGKSLQMAAEANKVKDILKWVFTDIHESVGILKLDALNINQLTDIVRKCDPDYIVNCAAFTAVDKEESVPFAVRGMNINGDLPGMLAEICENKKIKLIHISTDYVFDGKKVFGKYHETDHPNPLNSYGRHKLMGEKMIQKKMKKGDWMIIRTSWLYSPFKTNFVKKVYEWAKQAKEKGTSIRASSDEVSSPTSAWRLANFIAQVIENDNFEKGIWNFTDGIAMSRMKFAEEIVKSAGLDSNVKVLPAKKSDFVTPAKRPKRSVLSMSKTRKHFNVKKLSMKEWREVLISDMTCIKNWND